MMQKNLQKQKLKSTPKIEEINKAVKKPIKPKVINDFLGL